MPYLWIWATVLAALFQALRYAALKELNKHLSATVTGYARILYATPLMVVFLVATLWTSGEPMPRIGVWFVALCVLGSIGQFMSTVLMVRLFRIGNFAVGTMLAKTDAVITALIGTLFFTEAISRWGWVAIVVTVTGVTLVSAARTTLRQGAASLGELLLVPATQLGLLIALVNALSYLVLREAIRSVSGSGPEVAAALAGTVMTLSSCAILTGWLLVTDREGMARMRQFPFLCWFAGIASALGTGLWFLAAALTNVAYVAAVAQIQIVFALAISHFWFRETIRPLEIAGIGVILAGVLMFRLV